MKKQSPNMSRNSRQIDTRGKGTYAAGKTQSISKTTPETPMKREDRRFARGAPDGAHQGGASRGGSRVEPSHQRDAAKKDRRK